MAKKKEKKAPTEEIFDSAHKIWLAGLGAVSVAEEEGSKFFRRLVEAGEDFEERGRKRVKKARSNAEKRLEEIGDSFDERIANVLERLGVPTREDVAELGRRIDELTQRLDQRTSQQSKAGKSAAEVAETEA